ncbi:MAG: ferritin-like domain-containing protein [Variovorax sp.]|nr:MAG: ferritin-like domain-containing protein [Variovorax sp.]
MHPRLGALAALRLTDPDAKMAATRELAARVFADTPADTPDDDTGLAGCSTLSTPIRSPGDDLGVPGRPQRPLRVAATAVERRSPFTTEGRAALMHAICHIEFNAVNLALDAAWRYDGMPEAYYLDWLRVADEEARHFTMLRDHLRTLGADYGDFTGHDGLWAMCEKTRDDVLARMALVPRTLEARGLDATPLIQAKLRRVGTPDARAAVALLDIVLRDEIGHVAIGNRWYRWLCERDGFDPIAHYRVLYRRHEAPRLRAPFNLEARALAGFTAEELEALQAPEAIRGASV